MKNTILLIISSLLFSITGCKKLVDIDSPGTSVSSKNIYNNDATAIGAITSLYTNLSLAGLNGPGELTSLSCIAGLSADELIYYDLAGYPTLSAYYQNALTNNNIGFSNYWGITYQRLYLVNAALDGLAISTGLTPSVKQQLLGEVRFMRAFYYFYLVNLYGDVPLVLSTDYTINATITKAATIQVYQQIVEDLKEAQQLLSENYLTGNNLSSYASGAEERVRPTKWAATALLARAYLYMKDWSNAEAQATVVLENVSQYELSPLDQVFLKNNREAIWQIQPIAARTNAEDANTFVLPQTGPSFFNPVYLNEQLLEVFEADDQRKNIWLGSVTTGTHTYYYPNKYKIIRSSDPNVAITEYRTVMRLAEQFLIRAEARAEQNELVIAIQDLDVIRDRAKLPLIKDVHPDINKEDLLTLILKEKQIEFFSEWGHRWLDLKRTGKIDEVMTVITPKKGNSAGWKSYQQYYPIALTELRANPNLKQIDGY